MHNNLDRLWQLKDNQLERVAKFALHKFIPFNVPKIGTDNLSQSAGSVVNIIGPNNTSLEEEVIGKPSSMAI